MSDNDVVTGEKSRAVENSGNIANAAATPRLIMLPRIPRSNSRPLHTQ